MGLIGKKLTRQKEHPLYCTWRNMRTRCNNPSYKYYHRYGGRGITICDRWSSFWSFVEDMGEKPSPVHSIDRVDNNGDYGPYNCRWATQKEQCNNRGLKTVHSNNKTGTIGVTYNKSARKYKAYIGKRNLGSYTKLEEAIEARRKGEEKYW